MSKPKYKDSMFRDYFNDKVRLLSLCNALLNTNFTNPDELEINASRKNIANSTMNR